MDYTKTTWVDDDGSSTTGTDMTAARMNNIEDGIADAIAHNRVGALSSRPAAAAGNKNWLWIATDTDGTGGLYVSDGSAWTKMPIGSLPNDVKFGQGGWLNSFTQAYTMYSSNYNSATDRLFDTTRPAYIFELDARSGFDRFTLRRSPATAGSPPWVQLLTIDSAGRARDGNGMPLDSTPGFFGDGSDGAFTADGAAAMPGATRAGSVYTLTRDVYFTNLTVNSGVTIVSSGYRVFVNGTLSGSGTINANGGAGSGVTGGTGAPQGSVQGGWGDGGAGGTGAANGAASLTVPRKGGGGGGGGGGAGSNGFTAGARTIPIAIPGGVRRTAPDMIFPIAIDSNFNSLFIGGGGAGGGGGGSSTASATGGGGGGAGGVLIVAARILSGTVAFEAKGGAGAAGTLNGGGGGGGGGGLIHLIYGEKTNWTGTTSVAGGALGAGNGTGSSGTAGSAGNVIQLAA